MKYSSLERCTHLIELAEIIAVAASMPRTNCFLILPVGRFTSPVASGNKAMKCEETEQVLQTVLMAYPDQASSLQGSHGADCDILAANDLGIGSGWRQSKQN